MSANDVQWWSFVVGIGVFVAIVLVTFQLRRRRERLHGPSPRPGEFVAERGSSPPVTQPTESSRTERRRPAAPPPPAGEPGELASALRSAIVRVVAERAPAGWTALILTPPPHREQMTWHVHLAPDVALDLRDGRTVTVSPPPPSHQWQMSGGRVVGVGEGDPDPAPGEEATTVRVTGPYLLVTVQQATDQPPVLVARVVVTEGEEPPQPRAVATDLRAVSGALREAIELAIGSRMLGAPPAVGYPRASWSGHERSWLTIGR